MKTRIKTPILLLLMAAASACHEEKKTAKEESQNPYAKGEEVIFPPKSPKFRQLVIGEAAKGDVIAKHYYGRITTNEEVTVRIFSPVFGRVEKIMVDVNQEVHAGDVLTRLLSPDMGQAQSDAHKAAADLVAKTRIFYRTQDLLQHGAAAVSDLDQARDDMEQAQAEKARADVRLTQLYGSPTEILDGTYPLKTPISGVVVDKNINPGMEVRPDSQLANAPNFFTPLFTITDPSNLWIMVDVTEKELPQLNPGDTLTVRSTAFPGKKFPGKILKVGDMLDPATRTAKVRGSVENLGGLLKPEMYVNVDITGPNAAKDVVEVPSKAVLFVDNKHYTFVETSAGHFVRREVEVSDDHDEHAFITKGISVGERVVEDGGLYLQAIVDNADG